MQIEAPIHKKTYKHYRPKKIFEKNWQGVHLAEGEIPCRCANIALRNNLACPEIFGVYNIFFHNYHISYRLFAFFSEISRRISNRSGIFFCIYKIIKMNNLVVSITLAKKTPKVSQVMGLFLEKLETFKTF